MSEECPKCLERRIKRLKYYRKYHRKYSGASIRYTRYTNDEKEFILASEMSNIELAEELGRSLRSIEKIKSRMRKKDL